MEPVIVEPRPGADMGRTLVGMHVENADDLSLVAVGQLQPHQVRTLDVRALVDSGSTYASLTTSDIQRLGLRRVRQRPSRTATGHALQQIFSAVRVTVQGRDCLIEVAEIPDGMPALLGQVPLELMDYWVDTTNRRLVGNPEHAGDWIIDQL